MGANLQLAEVLDEPVKRYVLAGGCAVSGYRLDSNGKPVVFVIDGFDPVKNYADSVLEIYSQQEDMVIRRRNANLFAGGFLKVYTADNSHREEQNFLDDVEVMRIASIRNKSTLVNQLAGITSDLTLNRILKAAEDIGSTRWVLDTIKSRISEVASES